MPRQFFPKKSSAHRIACIALYRALLSHCQCIHLPAERLRGPINPIKYIIRNKFRQNQHLMSPRLITTALTIGYEAEELLYGAAGGIAAAHLKVLKLLQDYQAPGDAARTFRALNPLPPRPPFRKPEPWPGAPPLLETRMRPLSELSGRRHVPKFVTTDEVPFLRIKKPQSPFLSRIIRDLRETKQRRIDDMARIEDGLLLAKEEDAWDRQVGVATTDSRVREESWEVPLRSAARETMKKKVSRQLKSVELAKRMLEIVDREKEMYEEELGQMKREKLGRYRKRKIERLRNEKASLSENSIEKYKQKDSE